MARRLLRESLISINKLTFTVAFTQPCYATSFRHNQRQQVVHCQWYATRPFRPFGTIPLRLVSFVMAFAALNIFSIYTHYHDEYFHRFYPFPVALDVGYGRSMLPTIGCKLRHNDSNIYLRDCWSHRYIWFDLDNLKRYCTCGIVRLRRALLLQFDSHGGGGDESFGDDVSSSPSLGRPWQRGDIVTIYCQATKTTSTKRIIGIGGDSICVFGEYSIQYRSRYLQNDAATITKGDEDHDKAYEAATCAAGVPYHPLFPIPFCESLSSSSSSSTRRTETQTQEETLCNNAGIIIVPPNNVWLEGDNPMHSTDSRHYGPVPESSLRGRVVLRLWPFCREGYCSNVMVDTERPPVPDF